VSRFDKRTDIDHCMSHYGQPLGSGQLADIVTMLPANRTHDDWHYLSVPFVGTNVVEINSTTVSGSRCRIT
jgi:hypothetical protein